jgi:hypothetical protein
MSNQHDNEPEAPLEGMSRRSFFAAGSAALATVVAGLAAQGQTRENTAKAESDHASSDPGPENRVLLDENPDTAGSFRELHWHTADEWAFMEYGNARVTVLNPDGTMFIDDVGEGDLWFFPAGLLIATRQCFLQFTNSKVSSSGIALLFFVSGLPKNGRTLRRNICRSSMSRRNQHGPTKSAIARMAKRPMSPQSKDPRGRKQWESVHLCPRCAHVINLEEIDLRTITTGIINCPKCDWSGPVSIEIVEEEKPSE